MITKSMCITYEVEDSLYLNVTNKCSNRCDFCIRNNGDGAYGSDSLWLEREPCEDEILEAVFKRNLSLYREIVFCGYGEPSYRLDTARRVALAIKQKYPQTRIRINTNGQSNLICGYDTAPLYEGAFDTVSISLNSADAKGYDKICHSLYGENAFYSILSFAKEVKKFVPDTRFSVVGEFLTDAEIEGCRRISESCGVPLRVREYIPPKQD